MNVQPVRFLGDIESLHIRLHSGSLLRTRLSPDLSIAAAVELAAIAASDPKILQMELSGVCDAWKLMQTAGWPLNTQGVAKHNGLTAQVLPCNSSSSDWMRLSFDLKQGLLGSGFEESSAAMIMSGITELTNNVWEHSGMERPGLVAYRLTHRRVTFAVADLGIGVFRSLKSSPAYSFLSSPMAALQKAIEPGVSRISGGGRGYGFFDLVRLLSDYWGVARLRTDNALLTIDRTTEIRRISRRYLPPIPGLQIYVSCGLDQPNFTDPLL